MTPRPITAIVTARCTLEPQTAAHAPEMFVVLSDPAIYEFENAPPPSQAWLAERYARLESRASEDGTERWLNWVIRLPGDHLSEAHLAGYVQATVRCDGTAYVAYELNSQHWRQGLGSAALSAMLQALHEQHGVQHFVAVLKARNHRSKALLLKLGFVLGNEAEQSRHRDEADELVMVKSAAQAPRPA